jgi:hypothetical protein
MVLYNLKRIIILCVVFLVGCDYPPDEATNIQEQLQAQISKGQVYVMHSAEELSYVIKNSEFNRRSEAEQDQLISSVEKAALEVLEKYQKFKYIRIYFTGAGSAGIDKPYLCQTTTSACVRIKKQGKL